MLSKRKKKKKNRKKKMFLKAKEKKLMMKHVPVVLTSAKTSGNIKNVMNAL